MVPLVHWGVLVPVPRVLHLQTLVSRRVLEQSFPPEEFGNDLANRLAMLLRHVDPAVGPYVGLFK